MFLLPPPPLFIPARFAWSAVPVACPPPRALVPGPAVSQLEQGERMGPFCGRVACEVCVPVPGVVHVAAPAAAVSQRACRFGCRRSPRGCRTRGRSAAHRHARRARSVHNRLVASAMLPPSSESDKSASDFLYLAARPSLSFGICPTNECASLLICEGLCKGLPPSSFAPNLL